MTLTASPGGGCCFSPAVGFSQAVAFDAGDGDVPVAWPKNKPEGICSFFFATSKALLEQCCLFLGRSGFKYIQVAVPSGQCCPGGTLPSGHARRYSSCHWLPRPVDSDSDS